MSTDSNAARELYNDTATRWVRDIPTSLSDFTARPVVFELCEPVAEQRILDLGCGEGYCARELSRRGAGSVHGIDVSESMIEAASMREAGDPLGIEYEVGSATALEHLPDDSFDLALAVFLFNYLTIEQTQQCLDSVARVLRPGGSLVFSIPHPSFPFIHRKEAFPFHFRVVDEDYFACRDALFPGRIWKMSGDWLDVQLVHKTLEDYFTALDRAGFRSMPKVRELHVTSEHLNYNREFFEPLVGIPLHIAIRVSL